MNTDPQKHTIIPAEQAAKQERTVTVQVLTIGKKQVTQTLYRQLVEENVIDDATGKLKGDVWGWVNMHVGECDEKKNHLHVIWEREGQLRRACSYEQWKESVAYQNGRQDFARLAHAYIGYIALEGNTFPNWQWQKQLTLTVNNRRITLAVEDHIDDLWATPKRLEYYREELARVQSQGGLPLTSSRSERKRTLRDIQEDIDRTQSLVDLLPPLIEGDIRGHINQLASPLGGPATKESVYARMKEMADELGTFEQAWQASYQTIKDAGQLFIAVSGVWK